MPKANTLGVSRSAAGWFVAEIGDDGFPWGRISAEYYPTREAAQEALDSKTFDDRRLYAIEYSEWREANGIPAPKGPRPGIWTVEGIKHW